MNSSVPSDVLRRLEADFGAAGAPAVAAQLAEVASEVAAVDTGAPIARLLRCLVHLAAGNRATLASLLLTARADWRDVIFAAEYAADDSRIADFGQPLASRRQNGRARAVSRAHERRAMMPVASVSRQELDDDPSARTWSLVFHLAEHVEAQADPVFRPFWLTYLYDAEVRNGGHLQYFQNRGLDDVDEVVATLRSIGAPVQASLLESCRCIVREAPLERAATLHEYSDLAARRSFDAQDSDYLGNELDVFALLEAHFAAMIEAAVAVEG